VQWWLSGQARYRSCGAALNYKDSRSAVLRTVYGKVTVKKQEGRRAGKRARTMAKL